MHHDQLSTTLGVGGLNEDSLTFLVENPYITGRMIQAAATSLRSNTGKKHSWPPEVDSIVDLARFKVVV
jgi:hypothetical protein